MNNENEFALARLATIMKKKAANSIQKIAARKRKKLKNGNPFFATFVPFRGESIAPQSFVA